MPVLDGLQVTEAVAELIANALEADGVTTIVVRASTEAPDGRLVICVSDDGPGLSERALRHACDPFFSEKKAGRQQGLGLARACRLVGLNGGDIVLKNREDRGLTASLVFTDAERIFPERGHQSAA
jgi:signal transduction histidine kinase